jgi:hypothetical protein
LDLTSGQLLALMIALLTLFATTRTPEFGGARV